MKIHWIIFLFLFQMSLFSQPVFAGVADECSCPKVSCGPCQTKVSVGKIVRFCDWGDINVCKKEVCENVTQYFRCISNQTKKLRKKRPDLIKHRVEEKEVSLAYEDDSKKKKKKVKRKISSVKDPSLVKMESQRPKGMGLVEVGNTSRVMMGIPYSDVIVGKVSSQSSSLKLLHRGQTLSLSKGRSLYVGDEVTNNSRKKQKLSLKFSSGAVHLTLEPKSQLLIQDPHSIVGRFQPFLYLVYGGVKVKSMMKEGSFDLLAGQILVRSDKAQSSVKYIMEKDGLKVKVESQKGSVQVVKAQDLSGAQILVKEGSFLSWSSETLAHIFNSNEKQALASEGFISPVFEMDMQRKKALGLIKKPKVKAHLADWTKKKSSRSIASLDQGLCQSPQAQYQQCAWSCEGNSKGSKECNAQKKGVHCVRRMCNAAGQWGDATPFASSYRDLCPAQGVRVGHCQP